MFQVHSFSHTDVNMTFIYPALVNHNILLQVREKSVWHLKESECALWCTGAILHFFPFAKTHFLNHFLKTTHIFSKWNSNLYNHLTFRYVTVAYTFIVLLPKGIYFPEMFFSCQSLHYFELCNVIVPQQITLTGSHCQETLKIILYYSFLKYLYFRETPPVSEWKFCWWSPLQETCQSQTFYWIRI